MKVLGVSGSPRKNGATSKLIKAILEETNLETEFISLAEKKIEPCKACISCSKDNVCKLDDDMKEIRAKIVEADVVVIGGSNSYSRLNGLTHIFLERLYQFHHQGRSPIAGKLGVAVGVGGGSGAPPVEEIINLFSHTGIKTIGKVSSFGSVPCFTCDHVEGCRVCTVKGMKKPNKLDQEKQVMKYAKKIGMLIRSHDIGQVK